MGKVRGSSPLGSTMSERKAIMVPGIGPAVAGTAYKLASGLFGADGVQVSYFDQADWKGKKIGFEEVRKRFYDSIDKLYGGHDKVNLIGISAGGPLTLGAMTDLDDMVGKVATYAGCNQPMNEDNRKKYEVLYKENPNFHQMIDGLGEVLVRLTPEQLKRVLTLMAKGDTVVPHSSQTVEGAKKIEIPRNWDHLPAIAFALITMRKEVTEFFKEGDTVK